MVLTTAPANVACQLSPASAFDRNGFLRVRDPRVSVISLAELCQKHRTTLQPGVEDKIAVDLWKEEKGHSWARVAKLLGVTAAEVGSIGDHRVGLVRRAGSTRIG